MAFKMKGMHHGEGTGSFKKTSAFKEVPGGGPSVADRIRERRAERAAKAQAGETEVKEKKLFGRVWTKEKAFDPETGKKIGKRTRVHDKEGTLIGDTKGKGTLAEGYTPKTKAKKKSGSFDEAFAAHRGKMVKEHGPDAYEKWSNFIWSGDKTGGKEKQFHPYTADDIKKGADKTKSVPLKKSAFKNYKKGYYGVK